MCLVVLVDKTLKVNRGIPTPTTMAVVGVGIPTPNLLELQAEIGRLQQRLHDLCDRTEQERQ